jgi:DNA-binding Lrp family transcriptional regulator
MAKSDPVALAQLDAMILSLLEKETVLPLKKIARKISDKAQSLGICGPINDKTIEYHLERLVGAKQVRRQERGYHIAAGWKEGQPKAYILVMTQYPTDKKRGNHYQKILVDQIRESFHNGEHEGVNLVSAEIVMGHEYDVIVVIYSSSMKKIGTFVMDYLLTNKLIQKTHTVMVWPTDGEADPKSRQNVDKLQSEEDSQANLEDETPMA